jgi:hypothetical protein
VFENKSRYFLGIVQRIHIYVISISGQSKGLTTVGIILPGIALSIAVQGFWRVLRRKKWMVNILQGVNTTAVGLVFTGCPSCPSCLSCPGCPGCSSCLDCPGCPGCPTCMRISWARASHRCVSHRRVSHRRVSHGHVSYRRASHGHTPHRRVPHGIYLVDVYFMDMYIPPYKRWSICRDLSCKIRVFALVVGGPYCPPYGCRKLRWALGERPSITITTRHVRGSKADLRLRRRTLDFVEDFGGCGSAAVCFCRAF